MLEQREDYSGQFLEKVKTISEKHVKNKLSLVTEVEGLKTRSIAVQ